MLDLVLNEYSHKMLQVESCIVLNFYAGCILSNKQMPRGTTRSPPGRRRLPGNPKPDRRAALRRSATQEMPLSDYSHYGLTPQSVSRAPQKLVKLK